jgi:hypothetical protein
MEKQMNLFATTALLLWILGLVIIEGFWKTVLGAVFVPYAWYKAVEFILFTLGLI